MEEMKEFSSMRVSVDNKQKLAQLAAHLLLKDGKERSADEALEFATEATTALVTEDEERLKKLLDQLRGKKKK